jgi:hypothetical protein
MRGDPAKSSTLLPRGLAAWLCAAPLICDPHVVGPSSRHTALQLQSTEMSIRGPLPAALALIILRMTKEAADA